MLLILLFVIIFAASIAGFFCARRRHNKAHDDYDKARKIWCDSFDRDEIEWSAKNKDAAFTRMNHWETCQNIFCGAFIITLMALIVCIMILFCVHGTALTDEIEMKQTYNAIIVAEDAVDQHDASVLELIVDYNCTVERNQRRNASPWLNWFIPDFYDDLPLYDYNHIGPLVPIQ